MLTLTQLQTLQAVLRTGSFAVAGDQLGFTSSAISQQIAAFERSAGVSLFERGARNIRATSAAIALSPTVDAVLAHVDMLEREIVAISNGRSGVFRIGSFPTASATIFPGVAARLGATSRDISVLLDEAEPDKLIPRLISATLDLVIVYQYATVPQFYPPGVENVELVRESLVVLVRHGHRLWQSRSVSLSQLSEETWIASREGTSGARSLHRLCAAAGFVPNIAYRSNDYRVVNELVSAGMGVALVPALALSPESAAETLEVSDQGATRTVHALYRKSDRSRAVAHALEAIERSVAERARGDRLLRRFVGSV